MHVYYWGGGGCFIQNLFPWRTWCSSMAIIRFAGYIYWFLIKTFPLIIFIYTHHHQDGPKANWLRYKFMLPFAPSDSYYCFQLLGQSLMINPQNVNNHIGAGTHFTNDFSITIQIGWKFIWLSYNCWWSYRNKILCMPQVYICHAMCKIL